MSTPTTNFEANQEMGSFPIALVEQLVSQNEEYKHDITELYNTIMKLVQILGLTTPDGRQIKPEILSKEKNPMPGIIKSATGIFGLLMQAKFSKAAEKELAEKFSFFDAALPIIAKHAQHGG